MKYFFSIAFFLFQLFFAKANDGSVVKFSPDLNILRLKSPLQADSLTVYVFLSETCPICQNQTFYLRELQTQFSGQKVGFVGVFPNENFSTKESIEKFGRKYRLNFSLIKDENQVLTKQLGAMITPQVIVYQHNTKEIKYNGMINNGFERVGRRRQVITDFYLRDALVALTEGKTVTLSETKPVGCFIIK
jgi:peroxiredoxin